MTLPRKITQAATFGQETWAEICGTQLSVLISHRVCYTERC